VAGTALAADWDYLWGTDHGPENWVNHYPDCAGSSQSPIDIVTDDAMYDEDLQPLIFTNKVTVDAILHNTGHAIQVSMPDDGPMTTTLAGVESLGEYNFIQAHWHAYSEHTINGGAYPLEMHMVHHSAANAGTDAEYLVIGFMFNIGAENSYLTPITDYLDAVPNAGDEVTLTNFGDSLYSLLEESSGIYYNYDGSFTTPGCGEVVNWYVMQDVWEISSAQLDAFRANLIAGGINNRPTQPLNNRMVGTNMMAEDDDEDEDEDSEGSTSTTINVNFAYMLAGQ
jgi:carbonic anhydrase